MSPSGIADFTGFFLKPAHKSRVTRQSQSSDWYTPKFIFDALGLAFDLDPAHPGRNNPHCVVPTRKNFTKADDGLRQPWHGLVWLNPPFGGRRGQVVWLRKFFTHGNGIALVAARTSSDWFHSEVVPHAQLLLFPNGKTKFVRPDGSKEPGTGVVLISMGEVACRAMRQSKLGACYALVPSLTNNDRQADEDERTIERIEARILADYQEKVDADAFDDAYGARDRVAWRLAREPREGRSK